MSENSTLVTLTASEMFMAAQAGLMRQIENIKRKRQPRYGANIEADWQVNIEGALGEYAVARFLGIHWAGKGIFRGFDVGELEVRTASRDTYRLILHPDDHDDHCYYLVTGLNGTYRIRGWILGREGKRNEFWQDPGTGRPAFFIPQSALNTP